jgi:hypothetical protein
MPAIQPQSTKQVPLPAPAGGVNAASAATQMPETDALTLVNMIGGRLGVTSRLGYEQHLAGLDGEVRTVIPFAGGATSDDRLFAATASGIYDVSTGASVQKVAFGITSDDAGWGTFTTIATVGGHFILYADEANGLFRYTQSTDTWAPVTDITGVAPGDVVFVTTWKNRVWLVKRGTGDAYFLDVGTIAGLARRHGFGNKFRAGGYLVGLWGWTRDGGAGVDDFLVAISSAGDVLVYQGSDPAVVGAFELTGDWTVGAVPAGRRIASDFGGDLLVLSTLGVVPMSRIITGTLGPDQYTTQKIQPLFNAYAADRIALRGWSLRLHPEDNALLVNMPLLGGRYEQFAMSLATGGWSLLSGVPSLSSEVWRGKLYFGTPDGRVCVARGGTDNGNPVEWWGQSSFQTAGILQRKRVTAIQPLLVSEGVKPGIEVAARFDFDTSLIATSPPAPDTSNLPKWGTARWNQARWPGGLVRLSTSTGGSGGFGWRGASGAGFYASVAFRGRSIVRTTLMGFNIRIDTGGIQ